MSQRSMPARRTILNVDRLHARLWAIAALLLSLSTATAAPLPPHLIDDLDTDQSLSGFAISKVLDAVAGRIILVAWTSATGDEPWVYDATIDETHLLLDLYPGPAGSNPGLYAGGSNRVVLESDSYYSDTYGFGLTLIATDGTVAGTEVLAPSATIAVPSQGLDPACRTVGGRVLFLAENAGTFELWSTGTGLSDLELLSSSLSLNDEDAWFCLPRNGELWFARENPSHAIELWKTGGTEATTSLLVTLDEWPRGRLGVSLAGPALFFEASELIASDGTVEGTETIESFDYPDDLPLGYGIVSDGGRAIFFANDDLNRTQLWSSDGTGLDTGPLTSFADSDAYGSYFQFDLVERRGAEFGFAGTRFVFSAQADNPGRALWSVPSSGGSVVQLDSVCIHYSCGGGNFAGLARAGERLVFVGLSDAGGSQPHATDGTPGGTERLGSFYSGAGNDMSGFVASGTEVLFSAWSEPEGGELWRTDGTDSGTEAVSGLPEGAEVQYFSEAEPLMAFGRYWFGAALYPDGMQLWSTDGDPASTELETDSSQKTPYGSFPGGWAATNDRVAFLAYISDDGHWFSTDSAAINWLDLGVAGVTSDELGAVGLPHLALLPAGYLPNSVYGSTLADSNPTELTDNSVYRVRALFHAGNRGAFLTEGDKNLSLWMSGGTPGSTEEISDLPAEVSAQSSQARSGSVTVEGRTLFPVEDSTGFDLWRSDGTGPGTYGLDLPGREDAYSLGTVRFVPAGNVAFALASYDVDSVGRMWRTDGTTAGSTEFLVHSSTQPGPIAMLPFGGKLLFLAAKPFSAGSGYALYETPTSSAAPVLLAELPDENWPTGELVATRDTVCFTAHRLPSGTRIFCSDGTVAPLELIDIDPPGRSANPRELTVVGDEIYFAASDDAHGIELWSTDGTSAGTARRTDIAPGPRPALVQNLFFDGCTLFFAADDGETGLEPWALPFDPCPVRVFLNGFENGLVGWSGTVP